jgi:tRNA pseudouridine38-40 synthase
MLTPESAHVPNSASDSYDPGPLWKYAMIVSYNGTHFCGWQKQKGSGALGRPSIQETIEKALEKITGEQLTVVGSGRTDAGVHAIGQVAHFILRKKEMETFILLRGLNGTLPVHIQVLQIQRVAIEFHAQKSADKKQYSYYFQQGPCPVPHLAHYSWWIRKTLDLDKMTEGLDQLKGVHDFKSFQASGSKPGSTVRELVEADISLIPIPFPLTGGDTLKLVRVRLVGTGFLKQMVRGISGTLLQIGESRRPPSCMAEILAAKSRLPVGPTAPARALWLEEVWYPASFGLIFKP